MGRDTKILRIDLSLSGLKKRIKRTAAYCALSLGTSAFPEVCVTSLLFQLRSDIFYAANN
jgi:hypothetical protein